VRYKFDYNLNDEVSDNTITRAYLGYKGEVGENVTGAVIVDAEPFDEGKIDDDNDVVASKKKQWNVFLKEANFTWKDALPMTSVTFGLQGPAWYKQAAGNWGYNYMRNPLVIEKAGSKATGEVGVALPSADLGISFDIKPIETLNINVNAFQGDGHKNADGNMDNAAYGLTADFTPGMIMASAGIRVRNWHVAPEAAELETELTPYLHMGVKTESFRSGVELVSRMNKDGSSEDGAQVQAAGIYGVVPVLPILDVLARCEYATTAVEETSILKLTGALAVLPAKKVSVALRMDVESRAEAVGDDVVKSIGLLTEASF